MDLKQKMREKVTESETRDSDDSMSSDSNIMDDLNNFLENVNKLLENDFVKDKIQQTTRGGHRGRDVMDSGEGNPPQSPPPNQGGNPQRPQPITGEVDLRDYFADKIRSEEGRQELSEQIGALTKYLDPDATLEQIQDEVTSEEFVEKVDKLKEAGMI